MKPLAGLVVLSLLWGASFMFVKVILDAMVPVAVGWVRLGGGALFLAAVVAAQRATLPLEARVWGWMAVVAVFSSALPFVLIAWGTQHIDSGLSAILIGAMPLWVALLAMVFLPEERVTGARSVGVILGFVGVVIVLGPDLAGVALGDVQGQVAVLGAALCYAIGAVTVRSRLLGLSPTALAGWQTILAFVFVTPFALREGVPDPRALSLEVLLASAALGVLASGVAFLIYYWLLSNVGATYASLVTYLTPVTAVFWGYVVLDEVLHPLVLPGFLVIVVGIALVNRQPQTRLRGSGGRRRRWTRARRASEEDATASPDRPA